MAAPFDFTRVDPALYDWTNLMDCMRFSRMTEEFMDVVRNTPEAFNGAALHYLQVFSNMLLGDEAWDLAVPQVPELRLNQDYNTDDETPLNFILRTVKHKRPRARFDDPTTLAEKEILRKGHRNAINYLEACRRGTERATPEEAAAADELYESVMDALEK